MKDPVKPTHLGWKAVIAFIIAFASWLLTGVTIAGAFGFFLLLFTLSYIDAEAADEFGFLKRVAGYIWRIVFAAFIFLFLESFCHWIAGFTLMDSWVELGHAKGFLGFVWKGGGGNGTQLIFELAFALIDYGIAIAWVRGYRILVSFIVLLAFIAAGLLMLFGRTLPTREYVAQKWAERYNAKEIFDNAMKPTPSPGHASVRMSMIPDDTAGLEAYVATRPPCRGEEADGHIAHKIGEDEMIRTLGMGLGCWMRWQNVSGNNIHFEWWTAADHHFCVQIYGIPGIVKCDPTRDWSPFVAGGLRYRVIGDDWVRFEVWDNNTAGR